MNEQGRINLELIALTKQLLADSNESYLRDIKLEASLQRHLGLDSLGRAELFQRAEKHFHVSFPDKMLAEAETLKDIANYLYTASPNLTKTLIPEKISSHGDRPHSQPLDAETLIDIVLHYGLEAPDKAHVYFQGEDGKEEVISYGQLLQLALQVAQGLINAGLKERETVAIMLPTHPHFFYVFFGTLLAGGIPVPIYPPFRMHMLEAYAKTEAHILSNAEVRILVTFDKAEVLSKLLKTFVPSLRKVVTVPDLLVDTRLQTPFAAQGSDPAFIQYTSGSTSDPKGVLLTHDNLLANIRAYGEAINVNEDDVAVSWLPLYHDMGLIGMWLGSLYYGVPLVLLTPFTFLNHPERWLWAIHYHRGTLSAAPNFAYDLCVKKIDPGVIEGLDLSSWRIAANGAEKIYANTLAQFSKKFAPFGLRAEALLPVYGLAESTVGLTIPKGNKPFQVDKIDRELFESEQKAIPSDKKEALVFVACGEPLKDHAIRIVDENNQPLEERQIGHLQFRGPSSMQGYFNNPAGSAAIFHQGWWETGDLAYIADGQLYPVGRRKDVIIKAGRNLYPAEMESLIATVPGIRQGCVAAFGVTDQEKGTEQLIIVAETQEQQKTKRAQLTTAIHDLIASTLDIAPDHIVLVKPHTVPKTSSGKLQRSLCKNLYLQGQLTKSHLPVWLQILKMGANSAWLTIKESLQLFAKAIYTLYFILLFIVLGGPTSIIVRVSNKERAIKACKVWARWMLRLAFCPLTIVNRAYLTETSPVIFASNHASYLDAIVMLAILPLNTLIVAKKELFSLPFLGPILHKLNFIAIDRTDLSKGLEDTHQIQAVLESGNSVLIFPEGTFGYAFGLRPFKLGAFKIAVETNVPICPLALKGTRRILRDVEKVMRPGKIEITVGQPIKPKGKSWQEVTMLRAEIRAFIAKRCGEPSLDFIAAQTVALSKQREA